MSRLEDVRRAVEGTIGTLTPAKAQQLAKGLLEPGAAKEQVTKLAGDLVEWSQRNRERLTSIVRTEIRDQLQRSGAATPAELDDLKRRVRALEKAVAAGSGTTARSTAKTRAATTKTPRKAAAKTAEAAASSGGTRSARPASG